MSLNRYAKRRDSVEAEVFAALARIHAVIVPLGDAPCDAFVGWGKRWVGIEVKSHSGALTERQVAFRDACHAAGLPFAVVRTPDDALQAIGAIR